MRRTVESLLQFWRPVTPADAAVNVAQLLRRARERTAEMFAQANIRLLLQVEEDEPGSAPCAALVRGHEERLLQVFEHLLRNAAHAVSAAQARQSALRFSARGAVQPRETQSAAGRKAAEEATRAVRMTLALRAQDAADCRVRHRPRLPRAGPRLRPLLHNPRAPRRSSRGRRAGHGPCHQLRHRSRARRRNFRVQPHAARRGGGGGVAAGAGGARVERSCGSGLAALDCADRVHCFA